MGVPVFRVHDGESRCRSVPVAPIYRRAGAVNVKTEPEHRVWLVELDVFRKNCALFPGNADAELEFVGKIGFAGKPLVKKVECLVTQSRLRLWRAVVSHGACASILVRFCACALVNHVSSAKLKS